MLSRIAALVLRSAPLLERDRLISLFTPEYGVVRARATSALELRSRLAPRLVPPSLVDVSLVFPRSGFPIISSAETLNRHLHWQSSAKLVLTTWIFLSVLSEIRAPSEVCTQFFRMVVNLLKSHPKDKVEQALAIFLLRTMRILGVIGLTETCSICGKVLFRGTTIATPDFQSIFCLTCFNRKYGGKDVSFVRFTGEALGKLLRASKLQLLAYHNLSLEKKDFSILLSLFSGRVSDMLPVTVGALNEICHYLGFECLQPEK